MAGSNKRINGFLMPSLLTAAYLKIYNYTSSVTLFATRPITTDDFFHTVELILSHPSPSALHPGCYSCIATHQIL
ncbi:hypothetical protein A2U01_0019856 [Trifolium medium]|uniref:Uncharacterized protein n=1 Tax=Trifolium medium TaxID=97028 RepID=A0A392NG57_9FABA|nr:hypothetical protein [Trifolium medium]